MSKELSSIWKNKLNCVTGEPCCQNIAIERCEVRTEKKKRDILPVQFFLHDLMVKKGCRNFTPSNS